LSTRSHESNWKELSTWRYRRHLTCSLIPGGWPISPIVLTRISWQLILSSLPISKAWKLTSRLITSYCYFYFLIWILIMKKTNSQQMECRLGIIKMSAISFFSRYRSGRLRIKILILHKNYQNNMFLSSRN